MVREREGGRGKARGEEGRGRGGAGEGGRARRGVEGRGAAHSALAVARSAAERRRRAIGDRSHEIRGNLIGREIPN